MCLCSLSFVYQALKSPHLESVSRRKQRRNGNVIIFKAKLEVIKDLWLITKHSQLRLYVLAERSLLPGIHIEQGSGGVRRIIIRPEVMHKT